MRFIFGKWDRDGDYVRSTIADIIAFCQQENYYETITVIGTVDAAISNKGVEDIVPRVDFNPILRCA